MTRNITALIGLSALIATACGGEQPGRPDPMDLSQDTLLDASQEAGPEEAFAPEVAMVVPIEEPAMEPMPEGEEQPSVEIAVQSGENLVLIAQWASCSVEELGELNGLDVRDPIAVGQVLAIPAIDEGDLRAFEMERNAAGERRLERYLGRRGGLVGVDIHKVRTGETAWQIAHDQAGVPTWVIAAFNRGQDLERLGIGDELRVPILGDTVVDAGPTTEIGEPIEELPTPLEAEGSEAESEAPVFDG